MHLKKKQTSLLKRKSFGIILFLFLPTFILSAQEEEILQELIVAVQNASAYDSVKLERIENLRNSLRDIATNDLKSKYEINKKLLKEFKVFNQDSAYFFGLRTKMLAENLGSDPLMTEAILDLAEVTVSAGMYKETLDYLNRIEPEQIPKNLRSLYYGLLGRVYSELAEYSNLNSFSSGYYRLASKYRNLALQFTDEGTFFHSFLKAFISYKEGNKFEALTDFKGLLENNLNQRERALVHYLIGKIYQKSGNKQSAIEHYAKASILDIETSTKETLAIIHLSELLFERDDLKMASLLIGKANKDAAFYGAQHRKLQIGAILPLIEEKVISRIEKQKQRLYRQNIIVSLLLVFAILLFIIIYFQIRRLKKAKRIILKTHEDLQRVNGQIIKVSKQIRQKNAELEKVNLKLSEANKIKEEYIGFFFTQDANIFEKFREFKNRMEKDIVEGNLEKAKYTLRHLNLKKEKEKLMNNFDQAFIKLFPNFVSEFNSLLKDDEKISLKKGHHLNKELRIFALLRLGVSHNEIIAEILGYSVNSIYSYKTKIRKKSWLHTKDFDQKLIENTTLRH